MVGSSETKAPGNQDIAGLFYVGGATPLKARTKRIESIDLLRGVVMVIMAIDHVRDYFHRDAFLFQPEDLERTNVALFFTRFITHYCSTVFVFLAGTSAFLYGMKRSKRELSFFLFTRGLWLIFLEVGILTLIKSFNPNFQYINLQVIWAIGLCMIALSGLIYLNRRAILIVGIILVAAHNTLDNIHVPGGGLLSFIWAVLHEPHRFVVDNVTFNVLYPVIPWLGLMAIGYYMGQLFTAGFNAEKRKEILLFTGLGCIALFIALRAGNFYGEPAHWSVQKNAVFSILSFFNVTKYPPSLLYILITLGPSLVFLACTEKPLRSLGQKIAIYGRVPMFYYILHFLFIHLFAVIGAVILGYPWTSMILSSRVMSAPQLKGYGFDLWVVYLVWMVVVLLLYPLCKWYDGYKKKNLSTKPWLSYL